MLADAALALGRTDDAARLASESLTRATALQAGMPYSRAVGLAHFALARARAAQGRTEEARAESAAALDHITHAVASDHPVVREIGQFLASLPAARP